MAATASVKIGPIVAIEHGRRGRKLLCTGCGGHLGTIGAAHDPADYPWEVVPGEAARLFTGRGDGAWISHSEGHLTIAETIARHDCARPDFEID